MSTQHAQYVLLFLLLAVNFTQFQIFGSYPYIHYQDRSLFPMSTLSVSYRSENRRDDLHKRGEDLNGQHSGANGSPVVGRHLSHQGGEEVGALLVPLKHLGHKGAGVGPSIMT